MFPFPVGWGREGSSSQHSPPSAAQQFIYHLTLTLLSLQVSVFPSRKPPRKGREESRGDSTPPIRARGAAIPSAASQEQPPPHQKDFWTPSYLPAAPGSGNLCSIASLKENLPAAINSEKAPPGLENSLLQAFPRDSGHISDEIQGIFCPASSSSCWKQKGTSSKHLQPLWVTALQGTGAEPATGASRTK